MQMRVQYVRGAMFGQYEPALAASMSTSVAASSPMQVQDGSWQVHVGAWQGAGVAVVNVTLTCAGAAPGADGRFVVSNDLQLFNALALANAVPSSSMVALQLESNVSLSSCIWRNAPARITRNVTLAGRAGGAAGADPPVVLDLQGISSAFHLAPGAAYLTLQQLTLVGLSGVQGGSAPLLTTGHGMVAAWLWAFDIPRSLDSR